MGFLFSVTAGLIGGIAAVLLFGGRRPRRRKAEQKNRRKIEFSKLVLSAVLFTYFVGFGLGFWAVLMDLSQLGAFLAFVKQPCITGFTGATCS